MKVAGYQPFTPLFLQDDGKIKKDLTVVPTGCFLTITGLTPFLQTVL